MFNDNPFRILGVESNSGIKSIQKNLSKIRAYLKINKNLTLPYELSFFNLGQIDRSHSLVVDAENKILLDSNKIKYSLFWFTNENSFDEIALKSLDNGNFVKSEEIWRNVIKTKAISKKNFSAFNNLSTLLFLKSLSVKKKDSFENNIESKKSLIESFKLKAELIFSDHIFDFSKLICGNENGIKRDEALSFFNESASLMLNENFTKSEISKLISKSNKELGDSFNYSLISDPLNNLVNLINDANDSLNQNNSKGMEIGRELIKKTLSDLKLLKDILGVDNIRYQSISDKLANQIIQCGILYFNKTSDDNEYLSSYQYAKSISNKEKTKERADNTIKHCEDQAILGTCCGCEKNKVDFTNPLTTEMYKITEQNFFSNSVKYNQRTLTIYYCKECNRRIYKDSDAELYFTIGITLAIVIVIFLNMKGNAAILFALILGVPIYGGVSWFLGLFTGNFESNSISKQQIVKEAIKEGYSFSKPGK